GGFAGATDNSPLRANKGSHYEGGIRVPLIVSGPGILSGEVSDTPVITNDLYPTLLSRLGVEVENQPELDGVDLSPVLDGSGSLLERPLFWHYPHYNRHPQNAPVSIIREGDWKLIEFLAQDRVELYDLAADIGEENDISTDHPDTVASLRKTLETWRDDVGAEPMRPNPFFNPDKEP
ncbi:MAG: sulfatase/phosphatase domain-containing protein, partial [Verrucomicrobiota bacterium]